MWYERRVCSAVCTPLASTIFAMELVSVGVMYYAALVPCTLASIIACSIMQYMGIQPEQFELVGNTGITAIGLLRIVILGALCAGVSILFCVGMRQTSKLYERFLSNQYLRAFAGGVLVIGLALLCNSRDYLGTGMEVIARAVEGQARPEAFLLKMLFTVVTLGAGFKGGEIVPALFTGATFGCTVGGLLGIESSFAAALGMIAVFCGVTNCPITSLLLAFELFGWVCPTDFLLVVAVSYMLSGYFSLYEKQIIMYAKTIPRYIRKSAR